MKKYHFLRWIFKGLRNVFCFSKFKDVITLDSKLAALPLCLLFLDWRNITYFFIIYLLYNCHNLIQLSMGWWRACRWIVGRSSMVGGSVLIWSVDPWSKVGGRPVGGSVVGGLSVVGGFVIRPIYRSASNSFFLFSNIKNVKQNLIKFCLSKENGDR